MLSRNKFKIYWPIFLEKRYIFLSFFAGLIFLLNFLISNIISDRWINSIIQWTTQSNFIAFAVVLFYLFFSKSPLFKTNFLVLFAGNNLYVAGIGFWIILFPAVFVGLPEYVVPINNIDETLNNLHHDFFSYFWNHCITQICYFLFTISVFRSGDKNFMYPAKIRNLFASILIWSTYYIVIFGIALSLTTKIFPVYGIFSNFNPNTIYETYNGHKLFNGRVLSVSIIGIYLIGLIIVYLNWRISIQLNSDTSKKLLKNIDLK